MTQGTNEPKNPVDDDAALPEGFIEVSLEQGPKKTPMERMANWIEKLPELQRNAPYWTNGAFAGDCRDAAEFLREEHQKRVGVSPVLPDVTTLVDPAVAKDGDFEALATLATKLAAAKTNGDMLSELIEFRFELRAAVLNEVAEKLSQASQADQSR